MSSIMKYEESFMSRVEGYGMEDLMALARRANLPCVRAMFDYCVDESILRKALIQKYREGIFVALLTRFSREVAAYMCNFLGEPSKFYGICNLAIVIDNTSWEMYSNSDNEIVKSWAVKKTIESTNHKHFSMRDGLVSRTFSIDPSYDEIYQVPNYETVHEALLGVGYTTGSLHFTVVVPNDSWDDVDMEEFLSFPLEHGPTFMAWIDQPDVLPEWNHMLL